MSKKKIYLLGLVTLIGFPLIALLVLFFLEGIPPQDILRLNSILHLNSLLGIIWGCFFAALSLKIFNSPYFEHELKRQKQLLLSLKLSLTDKLFLSFCAGFGEEILFRSGMQYWCGIWFTSIFFIAIHGYLNPKKPRLALYGLFLIPFIVSLGYGLEKLGIWFCIFAHASYDLVLFLQLNHEEKSPFFQKIKRN